MPADRGYRFSCRVPRIVVEFRASGSSVDRMFGPTRPGGWVGLLALWLAVLDSASGCGKEASGVSPGSAKPVRSGKCVDDSSAPLKWRHSETQGLGLSPAVLRPGARFQVRPRNPQRTTYGLHLVGLDNPGSCSDIFYLDYEASGPTWRRMPSSGSFMEVSQAMHGRVIPRSH